MDAWIPQGEVKDVKMTDEEVPVPPSVLFNGPSVPIMSERWVSVLKELPVQHRSAFVTLFSLWSRYRPAMA